MEIKANKNRGILLWIFFVFYFASYLIAFCFNIYILYTKVVSLPLKKFPWMILLGLLIYITGFYAISQMFRWKKRGFYIWLIVIGLNFSLSIILKGLELSQLLILLIEVIIIYIIIKPSWFKFDK